MFIAFHELPEDARVWVYQSDRRLTEQEQARVLQVLRAEVEAWVTHGMPMRGSVQLLHDRLVVIAADTSYQAPSGCSIDASTGWLQALGQAMDLNFFDRSIGYFEGEVLKFFSVFEARKHVTSGEIHPDTPIINPRVASVRELRENLLIPANQSFLSRYFTLNAL